MLADEPTGALDTMTGDAVIELLASLPGARGTAVVLVTHEPRYAVVGRPGGVHARRPDRRREPGRDGEPGERTIERGRSRPMTLVVERPAAPAPAVAAPRRRLTSRWRVAGRVARREVRRRPGRTALVVALIAIPVIGMSVAATVRSTLDEPWSDTFARRYGAGDLTVELYSIGAGGLDSIVAELPFDTRSVVADSVQAPLQTIDGAHTDGYVLVTNLDITDPLVAGTVDVLDGAAPRRRRGRARHRDRRRARRLGGRRVAPRSSGRHLAGQRHRPPDRRPRCRHRHRS